MMFRSQRLGLPSLALAAVSSLLITGCKKDPNVQKHKYLESGQRYFDQGKYREAGIQYANAVKVDSHFADAHFGMAQVYLHLSNPMAAYQELMRTVDLDPSNMKARKALGSVMIAGGVPEKALDQAKAILAASPNDGDAYAMEAQAEAKLNQPEKALENIQHALAINPNSSSYHTTLAQLEAQNPASKEHAKGELAKAIQLDPKNTQARIDLAGVEARAGDHPAAIRDLQAAIQADDHNVQLRLALARLLNQDGQKDQAAQVLLDTAKTMPDNELAAMLLKDFYLQEHKVAEAKAAYAQLSADHPKSLPLKVAYAQILLEAGDQEGARKLVESASKTDANDPQVQLLNAFLLVSDHKVDQAYTLLQKATRNSPSNVALQLLYARVALAKGDQTTAGNAFHQAYRLDPSSLEAAKGLVTLAEQRQDESMLAQVAENTIRFHPEFSDAYLWRGSAAMARKEYAHADADFETARKLDPNNGRTLLLLGELDLAQGKTAEGRSLLEETLRHDPNALPALAYLTRADLVAKQPQAAVNRIQDVISRSPNNSQLYTMLAELQLSLKNFPASRDAGQKAMQLDPNNGGATQVYSQALAATGGTDQAIEVWQNWQTKHPNDPKAALLLGTLEESKGDASKAMDDYKRVLELKPNDPVASNNLAVLMVETGGNTDVALNYAQVARRGLPESPNTADTVAWVYYHKGTYDLSRDLLEDAAKQAPGDASIQYHLGAVYAKLNNKAAATQHLKQAMSLAPDSRAAKSANDILSKL